MAAPLASALEGLSGYRPVFPPTDDQHGLNPVNWSHVTLAVAGRTWHILSRVAEYGLDYSQRTNKLAHHVVLDSSEQITAGPAALLSTKGFMRDEWNEEPQLTPTKPVPKIPPRPRGVCQAWKDLTGDGGWAGVIAESFLRDPERPVILLYAPGQDMLPLIHEALSLIPANRRWEVTFTTYFTGLPQTVNCNWRCMLADSPEAHQSLRFVRALRFDLTTPDGLGIASGNELVADARGVPPLKSSVHNPLPPLPSFADDDDLADQTTAGDEYDVLPSSVPPLPGSGVHPVREKRKATRSQRHLSNASIEANFVRRRKVAALVGGVGLTVLLLLGLGAMFLNSSRAKLKPEVGESPTLNSNLPLAAKDSHNSSGQSEGEVEIPNDELVAEKHTEQVNGDVAKSADPVASLPKVPAPAEGSRTFAPVTAAPNQPIAPDFNTSASLPQGRKTIPLNRPGEKPTLLAEIMAENSPVFPVKLFCPPEMVLELASTKSKYVLREKGNEVSNLGSIAWTSIEQKSASPITKWNLNIKANDSPEKFQRLEWCEIEIHQEGSTSPYIAVLHPFPLVRKDTETLLLSERGKGPFWLVQWQLMLGADKGWLPTVLADQIILNISNEEFEFKPAQGDVGQDHHQILNPVGEKFKKFILRSNLDTEVQRATDSLTLKMVTSVDAAAGGNRGSVLVSLTIEGWSKLVETLKRQEDRGKMDIDRMLRVASNYQTKDSKAEDRSQLKKRSLMEQAEFLKREADRLTQLAGRPMADEALKSIANGATTLSNNVIKIETEKNELLRELKSLRIKSASLYYNISSSQPQMSRKVQIFKNDGRQGD